MGRRLAKSPLSFGARGVKAAKLISPDPVDGGLLCIEYALKYGTISLTRTGGK